MIFLSLNTVYTTSTTILPQRFPRGLLGFKPKFVTSIFVMIGVCVVLFLRNIVCIQETFFLSKKKDMAGLVKTRLSVRLFKHKV